MSEKVTAMIEEIKALGNDTTNKDSALYDILLITNEMMSRGYEFLPIDLFKSHATDYLVEDGKLRIPFSAMSGISDCVSSSIDSLNASEGVCP